MRLLGLAPLLAASLVSAGTTYTYKLVCSGPTYNIKSAFAKAGLVPPTAPAVDDHMYLAVNYNSSAVKLGNFFNQSGAKCSYLSDKSREGS